MQEDEIFEILDIVHGEIIDMNASLAPTDHKENHLYPHRQNKVLHLLIVLLSNLLAIATIFPIPLSGKDVTIYINKLRETAHFNPL